MAAWRADPSTIIQRLGEETDPTARRALVLALGEFPETSLPIGERAAVLARLREWYCSSPDPGMHAAAEWTLLHWKYAPWLKETNQQWEKNKKQRDQRLDQIRREVADPKGKAQPQWYVTSEGHTMVVIPGPVEFQMGPPRSEAGRSDSKTQHRKRIGRSFSIAAKLVTREQYRRFPKGADAFPQYYAPSDDCPIMGTSWYQAAEYCNWLSKQEGLPGTEWCYEPNKEGGYAEGMKPSPDCLKRRGYRLPTEAEWEYACRAGSVTSRYYGQSVELQAKYGGYQGTTSGGLLKPNDLGLFDMYGSVSGWCQDRFSSYTPAKGGEAVEDSEDTTIVMGNRSRVLRGGMFSNRSADRDGNSPGTRTSIIGFRPARTYP